MKNLHIISGVLAGILIVIYFTLVYNFTINIPMADDFGAIQDFLIKFKLSSSLKEKFCLLFSQYDLHRILFAKLIVLFVYAFSGGINYSAFIFIGNLLLLGLSFFMLQTVTNKKFTGIYILLFVLLFFNGQNFDTSTWAMPSIANVGVLFAATVSMYCMLNTKHNLYYCGLALSALTIFSNGNGMFIIPPIAIGLYLQNRKKLIIPFLCITLIFVLFYFYNFNGTSRTNIEFVDLIKNVHILLSNFFIFIGLNFWIPSYKIFSFLAGLFCILIYLFGICKKWYENNILIYALLTFYFLSAAAVAIGWFSDGEIVGALRYRIYSSPIIILTLFLIINSFKNFKLKYIHAISLSFLMFSLFSTFIYTHKEQKKIEWKKKSAYNWHQKGTGLAASLKYKDEHLREAEKLGLYYMPKYPLSEYASSISKDNAYTFNDMESISYKIENITDERDYLLIEGWGFLDKNSMNFKRIFVRLINQEQSYITSTFAERRYDLNLDAPLDRIENCGFFAVIDKKLIPEGTYQIAISIKSMFEYGSYHDKITEEFVIIQKL